MFLVHILWISAVDNLLTSVDNIKTVFLYRCPECLRTGGKPVYNSTLAPLCTFELDAASVVAHNVKFGYTHVMHRLININYFLWTTPHVGPCTSHTPCLCYCLV